MLFDSDKDYEISELRDLEKVVEDFSNKCYDKIIELYEVRKDAVNEIQRAEKIIRKERDTPKEILDLIARARLDIREFSDCMHEAEKLSHDSSRPIERNHNTSGEFSGTSLGELVNSLGPVPAVAIVTTFGTLGTSTLMSGLLSSGIGIGSVGLGLGVAGASLGLGLLGPVGLLGGIALASYSRIKKEKEKINKQIKELKDKKERLNHCIKSISDIIKDLERHLRELKNNINRSEWISVTGEIITIVPLINRQIKI